MCMYACVYVKPEKITVLSTWGIRSHIQKQLVFPFAPKKGVSGIPGTSEQLSERHNFKSCEENLLYCPEELLYPDRWELLRFLTAFCIVTIQCIPPLSAPLSHLCSVHKKTQLLSHRKISSQFNTYKFFRVSRKHILERASLALGFLKRTREKSQAKNKSRHSKNSVPSVLHSIQKMDCFWKKLQQRKQQGNRFAQQDFLPGGSCRSHWSWVIWWLSHSQE